MATIKTWEQETEKLDTVELTRVGHAIDILLAWGFFDSEFKDCGIALVGDIVDYTLRKRKFKMTGWE